MAKEIKTEQINIRMTARAKAALMRAADEDERSVSLYVERILVKHLTSEGFLKAEKRGRD